MKNLKLILFFLLLITLQNCKQSSEKPVYSINKTAVGESAMVVTAHPLATQAGLEILRQGGNAVDAAIAVQFALAVVYPVAGNIGGGGFMVIRSKDGELAALDFREKAPLTASENMYQDSLGNVIKGLSRKGQLAAGVPGTVDGMISAHKSYGKIKDFKQLIEPAIQLAREGFAVTKKQADNLSRSKETFLQYNTQTPVLVKKGEWKAGDKLIQKDLANTLELIRDKGRAGFYEGEVAAKIVREMQAGNGIMSLEDLSAYQAQWREPIVFNYKQYTLISMPPPSSGGIALAQLLKMVEPYPLRNWGFHSPETIHLMVEAERRVYADRSTHLGDSDYFPVPFDMLLDSFYLAERMSDFNPAAASQSSQIMAGAKAIAAESEETTHFSIIDQEGNAVAVTTTINGGYGSFVVVAGAGFLLNNEMDDFSAKPGEPNMFGLIGAEANKIEAEKRMLSSMTPTIILKDGALHMVVGSPGGSTIITSVFQTVLNVTEFGMSMTDAVSAKRFHNQWLPEEVMVEKGAFPEETSRALTALGHQFKERSAIGRVDAILVLPQGRLEGAADPRGDDHAEGY